MSGGVLSSGCCAMPRMNAARSETCRRPLRSSALRVLDSIGWRMSACVSRASSSLARRRPQILPLPNALASQLPLPTSSG